MLEACAARTGAAARARLDQRGLRNARSASRSTEEHPLNAQSPYAATKVGADQLALSYRAAFELPGRRRAPVQHVRPAPVRSRRDPDDHRQALRAIDDRAWRRRHPTRDFLYVADTAAGFVRCAEVDGVVGEVINLGTGIEISIGDVAERVFAAAREGPADRARRSSACGRPESEVERLSRTRARRGRCLDWEPTVCSTRACGDDRVDLELARRLQADDLQRLVR